jgi:hypothetical protein
MRLPRSARPALVVSVAIALAAWSGALLLAIDLGRLSTLW